MHSLFSKLVKPVLKAVGKEVLQINGMLKWLLSCVSMVELTIHFSH